MFQNQYLHQVRLKALRFQKKLGFDKVKKAIGNKQTYGDFLKLLNLFTQDIIDKDTLVERVQGFIGDTNVELFNWFKMFVGYEDKPQNIENITFKNIILSFRYVRPMVLHTDSYRKQKHTCLVQVETRCVGKF